ncbi:hypothetical protein HVA01_30220 [Halovibrio variabilis]|uniref:diguanylate cyclase n=1 Tax=Halovibrio variabilis TaxID=31910 RepID=A0A511US05_9GAMM|nr:GGDEF domain-containing protein [Halovibrio variabilis]GEN29376.1 hypothetical protein HVA01_30220 [Halovibrio variabilis]
MIIHRWFGHWRLASFVAVILMVLTATLGSYVYNVCQRASTDYTPLISDIVLAQQATPQLQAALEEGSRQPNSQYIDYIAYFISLSEQHLNNIHTSIEDYRYLIPKVDHLDSHFDELNSHLARLNQQVTEAQQHPELIEPLQRGAMMIGSRQAWLYTQLLDEVHGVAQQQRSLMQRFSIAVSVLLGLVASAAVILCMMVVNLHRQRNLMQKLVLTDALTGLYNRRHLGDVAFAALTQAKRHKTPLSLLLIDIDHFKHINDSYGHPVGDEVLRQLSDRLRYLSRPSDTLARIGGEEFCLLMPDTHTHDALQAADRLRREVEKMAINGHALANNLTISIGVTTSTAGEHNFERLYCLADKALYQAKANGRNRVESLLPVVNPPCSDQPQKTYFPQLMSQTTDP